LRLLSKRPGKKKKGDDALTGKKKPPLKAKSLLAQAKGRGKVGGIEKQLASPRKEKKGGGKGKKNGGSGPFPNP